MHISFDYFFQTKPATGVLGESMAYAVRQVASARDSVSAPATLQRPDPPEPSARVMRPLWKHVDQETAQV